MEAMAGEDPRGRGIANLVQWGALRAAAESLRASAAVVLVSGFYLLAPRAGETDGPPGAKALGEALRTLGKRIHYVTDDPHLPFFEAMGVPAENYEPTLLERLHPDRLVAIERPGRAADGRYYSMSAQDVTEHTAPIDDWFLAASRHNPGDDPGVETVGGIVGGIVGEIVGGNVGEIAGENTGETAGENAGKIVTVAIGDGGNEIGMGNVSAQVRRDVPHGETIASTVPADHLIVAGVSNFGAYALAGGLSLLAGRDLLPTRAQAGEDILACVAAGACCGHTFRNEPLVDGLPLEASLEMLDRMRALLG